VQFKNSLTESENLKRAGQYGTKCTVVHEKLIQQQTIQNNTKWRGRDLNIYKDTIHLLTYISLYTDINNMVNINLHKKQHCKLNKNIAETIQAILGSYAKTK
jgi:hypothetical protein